MREGDVIAGRYRSLRQLGSGGSGVVWLAYDERLDRDVAMKRPVLDGAEARVRLEKEAKAVAAVSHDNLVGIHNLVEHNGSYWLDMEYVESTTLDACVAESVLDGDTVVAIGLQLVDALEALEHNKIVHGDVKPENVLVKKGQDATKPWHVKLTDFGTSCRDPKTRRQTLPRDLTPAYGAPEVAAGEAATMKSDVFSLGVTLLSALKGADTFKKGYVSLIQRSPGGANITRKVGRLGPALRAMLANNPAKRPDLKGVRQLLNDAKHGPVGWRWRRHWVTVTAIGAAGVVLAAPLIPHQDQAPPGGRSALVVGDPITVNPCGLIDPARFRDFMDSELDPDYGNFNRCDLLIDVAEDDDVDLMIQFEFDDSEDEVTAGDVRQAGLMSVVSAPGDNEECTRRIRLPDRHSVGIVAKTSDPTRADLCEIADRATDIALTKLTNDGIPRRSQPFSADSLAQRNICALAEPVAVSLLPDVDPSAREIGFGSWQCRWHSRSTPMSLLARFDRASAPTTEDGRLFKIGTYDAVIVPEGYGEHSCSVSVSMRPYIVNGRRAVEMLLIAAMTDEEDQHPMPELCDVAAQVAARTAPTLDA